MRSFVFAPEVVSNLYSFVERAYFKIDWVYWPEVGVSDGYLGERWDIRLINGEWWKIPFTSFGEGGGHVTRRQRLRETATFQFEQKASPEKPTWIIIMINRSQGDTQVRNLMGECFVTAMCTILKSQRNIWEMIRRVLTRAYRSIIYDTAFPQTSKGLVTDYMWPLR